MLDQEFKIGPFSILHQCGPYKLNIYQYLPTEKNISEYTRQHIFDISNGKNGWPSFYLVDGLLRLFILRAIDTVNIGVIIEEVVHFIVVHGRNPFI